jgi:replicative DNA helicase Mcm
MRAIATHTDVNELEPGETVRLTGIVKDESGDQAANEYYIQITGIEHLDKSYAGVEITDDEEEEIKEIAASDHVHSHLKSSIAPTIKGDYDLAREALLLQLVGGVGRGDDQRSQIHVALVGDPGTGKTSLSRYTDKIAPNSEYQSADNVTKVGLTAAVTREERFDTAQWTLSGGVLVRADGGHAIIDELDKAPESVQSSLQEPLQDQVIDVSKASISATLPARCSVLLVANPDNERYDRYQEISKQIPITPTIWSRMDAIIPFVDEPDEEVDGAVVESILNQATGEEPDVVSPEMMRKYVSYARQIDPVLSEEAERYIDEQWSEIRQQSASGSTTIGYRQAKSLVRFAEASARIRLSETATIEDAERAVSLLRGWMDLIASDEDGSYNIDAVESGADLSQRQRIEAMWRTIDGQADDDGWAVRDDVVSELVELGIDKTDAQQTLNKFLGKGDIEQDDGRLRDLR